jgi:hypothetical protein
MSAQIFASIYEKAMTSAVSNIQMAMRNKAISAGWPEHLANSLSLDEKGKISYPEDYKQHIEDLEYGTQLQPANSVIRLFSEDKHILHTALMDMTHEYLFETGEVF